MPRDRVPRHRFPSRSVNNERVSDEGAQLAASQLLGGRYAVLRRGRRSLAVVHVAERADVP